MIAHLIMFGDGLLRYFLLCLVSVAAGFGLLRLLRLALPLALALVLAPTITLSCWAVVLGIGGTLRVPVRYVALPIWFITLGLALYGLSRGLRFLRTRPGVGIVAFAPVRHIRIDQAALRALCTQLWPIALCSVLPVIVMLPYFRAGLANYFGSWLPDGWSYIAYGQYLWQYSRGAEGGLAPLYQYAAHLSQTRFIAASLLGFLSPFMTLGATQSVSNLFLAWGLFTFAASCAFFAQSQRVPWALLVGYLVLVVLAGWMHDLLWANNFDNILALAFLPTLVGVISLLNPQSWAWRLVLGLCGAALLYCYPELSVFILGGAFLMYLERSWRERAAGRAWLMTAGLGMAVMLLLSAPFLPTMYAFLVGQASSGLQSGGRPGEGFFPGLISPRHQPGALWSLGSEWSTEAWPLARNLFGALLSALALVGWLRLLKQRRYSLAALIGALLLVCAFFMVAQRYSYGTYKIILLIWWGLCFTVVLGMAGLVQWVRAGWQRQLIIGVFALILFVPIAFNRYAVDVPSGAAGDYAQMDLGQFRTLEQLKQVPDATNLLVAIDDDLANQWAVYFLRDIPIHLEEYRVYMAQAHVMPYMERAQLVTPESTRYVLTDARFDATSDAQHPWALIWSGGPYRLWDPAGNSWAKIIGITNPNGLETLDGQRFFWIGQGDTVIDMLAGKSGTLHLSANFLPGPSVLNQAYRTIQISTDSGYSTQIRTSTGVQNIVLPIAAGETKVTLHALDQPTAATPSSGDTRPLVVGVKGITASLDDTLATVEQIQNANGLETLDGKPFFWLGDGATTIHMRALQAGKLTLQAMFQPGPSLPNGQSCMVLVESDAGFRETISLAGGQHQINLPVQAGTTVITLTPLDVPLRTPAPNGDVRPLLLGVQDMTVWITPGQS